MPIPVALRGLIAVVDRALDPGTATRNAGHAAADLAAHVRQIHEVERDLREPAGADRDADVFPASRHGPTA